MHPGVLRPSLMLVYKGLLSPFHVQAGPTEEWGNPCSLISNDVKMKPVLLVGVWVGGNLPLSQTHQVSSSDSAPPTRWVILGNLQEPSDPQFIYLKK